MERIESHAFLIACALLLAAFALFMNGAEPVPMGSPARSVSR